jgi:redox-sensitive bicupin YhaK (pirin superfamily)
MTAASGVVHEEWHERAFTRRGGTLEMVQLWVNLPSQFKRSPPGYKEILARRIPVVRLDDGDGEVRVIAGTFRGVEGPARTFTPVSIWDVRLKAGHHTELGFPDGSTTLLLVLRGNAMMNGSEAAGEAELAIFDRAGEEVGVEAREDATLLARVRPVNPTFKAVPRYAIMFGAPA